MVNVLINLKIKFIQLYVGFKSHAAFLKIQRRIILFFQIMREKRINLLLNIKNHKSALKINCSLRIFHLKKRHLHINSYFFLIF